MKNRNKLYLVAGAMFIVNFLISMINVSPLFMNRIPSFRIIGRYMLSYFGVLLLGLHCLMPRNHRTGTLLFCGGFVLSLLSLLFNSINPFQLLFLLMCVSMIALKLRPCKWTAIASGVLTALYILFLLSDLFGYFNLLRLLCVLLMIGAYGLLWLLTGGHHLIPALADAADEQDVPINMEEAKAAAAASLQGVASKVSASVSGKSRHSKLVESTLRNLQQQLNSGFITQAEYEKLKREIEAEG